MDLTKLEVEEEREVGIILDQLDNDKWHVMT